MCVWVGVVDFVVENQTSSTRADKKSSRCIASQVIPNKLLVAAILCTKVAALYLYLQHGRHDAPHGPTAATVRGVWEDHDNMHGLVVVTLTLQLLGSLSV